MKSLKLIAIVLVLSHAGFTQAANIAEGKHQLHHSPDALLPAHYLPHERHHLDNALALSNTGFENHAFAGIDRASMAAAIGQGNAAGKGTMRHQPDRIPLPLIAHFVTVLIGAILFTVSLKTHRKKKQA